MKQFGSCFKYAIIILLAVIGWIGESLTLN